MRSKPKAFCLPSCRCAALCSGYTLSLAPDDAELLLVMAADSIDEKQKLFAARANENRCPCMVH